MRRGFRGLIDGDVEPLASRAVGGIMQRGGTVLGSARCPEFATEAGRRRALVQLADRDISAVVVVGGNGSQRGAAALSALGVPVVGIASTIDNDLAGSDVTIGVDTALNIALEAIDRLKTTAVSHQRAVLVEVMGRDCGYLALMTGIAGGAEVVIIPEVETTPDEAAHSLRQAFERGNGHAVAVVAEGAAFNASDLAAHFREHRARIGFDLRVTVLGHVLRGGRPTAFDRILATRLGAGAIGALARGETGVLVGMLDGRVTTTPLVEVVGSPKPLDPVLFELARVLGS